MPDFPEVSKHVLSSVSNEMGYTIDETFLRISMYALREESNDQLSAGLKDLLIRFKHLGGRNIDLADQIDGIRVVLAARAAMLTEPST